MHDADSIFVPATTKAGQVPHRLAPQAEYRYENLTIGEILSQMQDPPPGRFLQATLPVQNTAIEKWTLDLEDALFVNDTQEAGELNMPRFASTAVSCPLASRAIPSRARAALRQNARRCSGFPSPARPATCITTGRTTSTSC